jgi:hypothetical protein
MRAAIALPAAAFNRPMRIPIFPLGTVLFPGGVLPLRIFETRYMDMTRACMKGDRPFGVCLIRSGSEVGAPAIPEPVGCLAHITDWDMQQLGVLHLKTRGGQRFRIIAAEPDSQGLVWAQIELIDPEQASSVPSAYATCTRLLARVIEERGSSAYARPLEPDNAAWVGFRLAEILPLAPATRQQLLELGDSLARLAMLQQFLEQLGLAAR